SSKSSRMSCWCRLMTRSLVMVGLSCTARKSHNTPAALRLASSSRPLWSSPTSPTRDAAEPSAARLSATLPAPPGLSCVLPTRTTATGASGEIRDVLPCQYRSSMTSPTTSMRALSKRGMSSFMVLLPIRGTLHDNRNMPLRHLLESRQFPTLTPAVATQAPPPNSAFLAPRYWPTWLGIGFLCLVAWLPFRLRMAAGTLLGHATRLLARERRYITATNLRLCFPELAPA